MDLVNVSGFEAIWLVSKIEPPSTSLTVLVKGTYKLRHEQAAVRADEQIPLTGDEPEPNNPAKPLRYANDFLPFKPRADLLIAGKAFAPGARPVAALRATVRVGAFTKTLAVIGDRFWEARRRATEPVPFTEMPLGWDRAYGGPKFARNPLGRGDAAIMRPDGSEIHPLPNLEWPDRLIASRSDSPEPAGLGPLPEAWPQRAKKFGGKMDRDYLEERWPWFPKEMDWGFFNCASEDQQIEGFLRGDEELFFENLHPNIPNFRSRLPGLRVRAALNEQVGASRQLREVPLQLDTFWADVGREELVLVWRGHAPVRTEDLLEVHHVFIFGEALASRTPLAGMARLFEEALIARDEVDDELEPEEDAEEIEDDQPEEELEEQTADEPETAEKDVTAPPADLAPDEPSVAPEAEADIPSDEADDALTVEAVREKIGRRESFAGCDLTGLDMAGFDFSGLDLREAILAGAVLTGANLTAANCAGAVFASADLRGARGLRANFTGVDLSGAWLAGGDFSGADFSGADFTKAQLRGANFTEVRAPDAFFEEADLSDACFARSDLSSSDLCGTRLHRTDFRGAKLDEVAIEDAWGRATNAAGASMRKLRGASSRLPGAQLSGIQANESVWEFSELPGSDLSRANLDGAELTLTNLSGATLDGAEMKSARLNQAILRESRLRRTNLLDASMEKANLTSTDLTEANLFGATLADAVIQHTNLTGANLRRIKSRKKIA